MRDEVTGARPALPAAAFALAILGTLGLSACTTVEGTNAMTDIVTFEREVMTSTLQGLGAVPREEKEVTVSRRAPLVIPRQTNALPAPQESRAAELPSNSNAPQIDTAGLSENDLRRLRNARVVDLRTLSGRPLTDAEARQLTARMTAQRLPNQVRPLYLPPDEYFFTTSKGEDLVCLAANGDLVPVNDPACPPAIRRALAGQN